MAIPSLRNYRLPQPKDFPGNKASWLFEPHKAILLIHDMQDYFLQFFGNNSPLVNKLIENIHLLKVFCKEKQIPIIYTAQPKVQSDEDRALLNDIWGAGLNRAPHLQNISHDLTPDNDDIVIVKWRYSAFQRSSLEETIKELGRDQLIICGVYGHIGCMITAVDAFMRDIKPFLVGDAIADFTLENHLMALKYVAERSGMVVSTKEIISSVNFDKSDL
ncbi:2,3-dihydro-2,3-dihydroxybenzoate synthetase [Photorhabdus luminescens]|nr:2,3-dihydro-2,3-dihydroxybenzoate synthetase [Photorhabdus luminescens]